VALEISEIGIRLAVAEPSAPVARHVAARASGPDGARLSPQQMEELVNACVLEVLRTLRMLEDR
jgi:hypothetical protein